MNVVQNSQKSFVRIWMLYRTHRSSGYGEYRGKYTPSGEEFDLKWRISSNLHGMFSLGQRPRGNQTVAVWALSTTTTEAIQREPQRVSTGATAALTATDHSTAYPGGGASKKIMGVASPILPPARSAKRHGNQAKRPKTCLLYTSPSPRD